MMARTTWKTLVIAGFALGLLGLTVQSTTTSDILIDGTISESKVFDSPVRMTVRELTLKPGAALPLHYHPGHVFIGVKSGTLTVEDGCGEQKRLTSGQGLEKWNGRAHRGKNVDATDVVVYDIFFTATGKPTTVTIPANERRCGPPRDVDECTKDGWRRFNHPRTFMNQGQCAKFVREMPRTLQFQTVLP